MNNDPIKPLFTDDINKITKIIKQDMRSLIEKKSSGNCYYIKINRNNSSLFNDSATLNLPFLKMNGIRSDIFFIKDKKRNKEYRFKLIDLYKIIKKIFENDVEIDVKYKKRSQVIEIWWEYQTKIQWFKHPQKMYRLKQKSQEKIL